MEVIDILEVCQTVVIRIRNNASKKSPVLKECSKKEKQLKSVKSTVEQMRKMLSSEQMKFQQVILENRKFEDTLEDMEMRIPEIEAAIIRQTPVSANYLILKQQKISHEVSNIVFM